MQYLNRAASGLPGETWDKIDYAAISAARDILTGRRFLSLDGIYGLGLTALEVGPEQVTQMEHQQAEVVLGKALAVPMLRKAYQLSIRRVQAHLSMGHPLDLSPAQDAAEAIARLEDALIYYGHGDIGLPGLMKARGSSNIPAGNWNELDEAVNDVLAAVNRLDQAGFHGPYALAMSPLLYNNLFRRYEGTNMLQLEHLRRLCEGGLYKAPIEGAVLVDPHVGDLVLGQDLITGFSGSDGVHYHFFVVESIALRLQETKAICILSTK